jgi:AraC-like DNA-binding protein
MAKTDRENTDHLMHGYLNMLASMYGAMNDYDNALRTTERNLQLTMEGTRWGAAPNQQLIDRRMALAKKASVLAQMGRSASGRLQAKYYQQADSAYEAWKAVRYEGNHTRDYFIVDYMKKRGRYQEAVTIYNDLIDRVRQQGDTLGEMMNTTKWGLAEVYRKMGRYSQAATLYEQVLEIQDTLKSRKAKNTAQELAAIYHEKEQEQTIIEQQAENTRQRYLLFSVLAVLIGVTVLAVIIIRKNRIISRKNQLLVAQITEAVNYKQMYWDQKLAQKQEQTPKTTAESVDNLKELTDEQLFLHINEVIMKERLYLDPNFGRQSIMDRFQLSKDRVGAVFSKGSEYVRLNKYILQLRLEYAAHLLINEPERTIVQIAADSGFGSSPYFSDRFRQHYGMSPTDFRTEATKTGLIR